MAFQIDPNIPLQAGKVQFDPASILMQAQQNGAALEKHRFEMQKLREDYDAAKEKRKQEKAMQMGIASDLAGIQSGSPAQYAPTRFEQQPQRGQMPQGMTGVMMREQGQQMPQPQAFGEEILQGNFNPNGGGEVTQQAVAGREPTYPEMLAIGLKQAMLAQDDKKIMEYAKELNSIKKDTNEYYGGLTEGIDPKTGQPVLLAMTKTGAVPSGYSPKPKDGKAVPVTHNGQPVTVKVPGTNEVKILMSDNTYTSGGSIPAPQSIKTSRDPVETALKIAEGKEKIKTDSEQRKTVAGKYTDAAEVIPILNGYITDLEGTPANFASNLIYKGVGLFSKDNPELQAVARANQKAKTLINYAQKQPGPSTDADVRNYLEQVGIASDITQPRDARLEAAKSARDFAYSIVKKFGKYSSKILSGEVTPEELQNLQPAKPTLDEKFQAMKEYKANRAKYAKDPTALRILDDQARADGLIK
jgi:hypothetical protein